MRFISFLLVSLIAFPALSAWQLDSKSSTLSFVSIKKGDVAEAHTFTQLDGQINEKGDVIFSIDLTSVNTNVDIRNDRMQQVLFKTSVFPQATFSANVDADIVAKIAAGKTANMTLSGEISLHGHKQKVVTEVLIARLDAKKMIVTSLKPVLINANQYDLVAGVQKLRELAGLSSISNAVPVSFVLVFNK